jgi:hypothetical protein
VGGTYRNCGIFDVTELYCDLAFSSVRAIIVELKEHDFVFAELSPERIKRKGRMKIDTLKPTYAVDIGNEHTLNYDLQSNMSINDRGIYYTKTIKRSP